MITDVNITIGKIRHYVDFSATGSNDGTSWDNAYPDLQDAITAAEPGEEIWVAAGLYTPGTTREASFELQHEVAVYGGFNGTEDYRHQRNPRANITILSGEIGNPSIKTDNTYHVITTASTNENRLDETAVLDGFTITGGYADHFDNPNDKGGGFLNNFGTPTLVNLNFVDNYALNHGGAIATQYNSNPLTVINSTFSGNRATNNAGGIANLAKIKVVNSSLVGNLGGNGGAIVGLSGTQTEVYNSILWDNQGNDISLQGTATATVTYSIVEGGFASGTNILVGNPLFVDADGLDDVYGTLDDDLHLQSASPAIDAGDNNELLADVADSNGNDNTTESIPVDFEGGSRLVDDPATPNTGNGSPPVDMGVDEFESPAAIMGLSAASSPSTLLGDATIFAARILSGTQTAYSWDFGDGNYSNNGAVSHTYTLPGVYQVVLSAVNSLGGQQAYATVTISEAMLTNPGDNVSTTDGVLTFEIPDSATGSMTFTYTPQTAATQPLGNFEFGGVSFQLLAVDNIGNPISEPGTPITLTLRYDESALPPGTIEANLELHRFDDATMQWVALTVLAHDTSTNTITVMLDHFSEFALLLEQYRIYLPILLK